jgi:hypothetical protein
MNNLLDNIINELKEVGIYLLEEDNDPIFYYHRSYQEASRNKVKEAISKAIIKSMEDK